MNFWPIDNNLIDVVGGAHMTNKRFVTFVNDRNGETTSAISFNNGYYSVPPGIYFTGDFTITFWGFSITGYSNFISFTVNANYLDAIIFYFGIGFNPSRYLPRINIYNGTSESSLSTPYSIELNVWDHFAITLSGKNASIFVNGSKIANGITNIPNNVNRTLNYFGTFPNNAASQAKMDCIKFYNRSVTYSEIKSESKQTFDKMFN